MKIDIPLVVQSMWLDLIENDNIDILNECKNKKWQMRSETLMKRWRKKMSMQKHWFVTFKKFKEK